MFKNGPNYTKLKTNLRLIINRLKLLEKKKTEMALKSRKEIADYISAGKDDRARIRVEHIIREDFLVEAMELLEMYCDLLLARFGLIQTQKELDPGLEESIATVIWATPRLQADVQELKSVTNQFTKKYGEEFAQECRLNKRSNVSEKVIHRLSLHAPPKALVELYMVEIAKTYNVPFVPAQLMSDELSMAGNLLTGVDTDNRNHGRGSGGGGPSGGVGVPQSYTYPSPSMPPYAYPVATGKPNLPFLPSEVPNGSYNDCSKMSPTTYNPGTYNPTNFDQFQPPPKPARRTGPTLPTAPNSKGANAVFPDLPAVPSSTLSNVVGARDDADFDDLTRRFEDLKNKK